MGTFAALMAGFWTFKRRPANEYYTFYRQNSTYISDNLLPVKFNECQLKFVTENIEFFGLFDTIFICHNVNKINHYQSTLIVNLRLLLSSFSVSLTYNLGVI